MVLQYGINFTASDMKSILERNNVQQNGIRTWRRTFGGAGLGYAAHRDTLTQDYADVISQAYKSNMAQQNAIMGAGLNLGAARDALAMSRQELQKTYDAYRQNFAKTMADTTTAYTTELDTIEGALTDRATNFAALYKSAYDYLSEELANATFAKDATDYLSNYNLSWLKDENGNVLPWNILSGQLFEDGVLTDKGAQFFDAMFNATPGGYNTISADGKDATTTRNFQQWLSDTNADLYEWQAGQDNFNYNLAGTNFGTANVLTGRESTDFKYGPYEYARVSELLPKLNVSTGVTEKLTAAKDAFAKYEEDGERIKERDKRNTGTAASNASDTREGWGGSGPKARDTWNSYLVEYNANTVDALSALHQSLGTEGLSAFNQEYKALINEYTALYEQARDAEYYDEETVNKLNDWRNRLLDAVKTFTEERAAKRKKISGL